MNFDVIKDTRIELKIRIGKHKIKLRDLLEKDIGHYVDFPYDNGDYVELLVQDKVIGKGEIVSINNKEFGVKIIEIYDSCNGEHNEK